MGRLVIDSSVVIKWFVPEVGSEIADRVLERYHQKDLTFLVPDLLFAEIGNVVWKKHRLQALDAVDAQAIIHAISLIQLETTPAAELLTEAYDLATAHQRTVYDSLYLALSVRQGVPFLSADQKLIRAVDQALPDVFALEDWPLLSTKLDHGSGSLAGD